MKRTFVGAALFAILVGRGIVAAHHPTARVYRNGEAATIHGKIVSLVVKSPHSYFYVEAPDRFNKLRVWSIECGDSRAFRRRVEEKSLKLGDVVVVTGDPALDEGLWRLRLRRLVRPADGWQWNEMEPGAR